MTGYVENRGKNTWRLVVNDGYTPDGKRKRNTKTIKAKNKREAEQLLGQLIAEIEKGRFIDPTKLTFKDFAERWLSDYAEVNLAPKTVFRYKQLLNSRIFPAMGHLKVDQIRPTHLLEFYKNLQEEDIRLDGKQGKLSTRTILHHHRLLSAIFNSAVKWQVILNSPAVRVNPPKVNKTQVVCYNEEQATAMLKAMDKEPLKYKTGITLTLVTGLRQGELMGLEWQDINFEESTITIRQASQYLPGKGLFPIEPKHEMSKRIISIPFSVLSLFKAYRKEWLGSRLKVGDLWQGTNRLFATWDGKPMYPSTITHWFTKFQAAHNLPRITFHALRHTSASWLMAQGLPLKSISSRLGHANISTTADIYGHALKSVDREIAKKFDGLLTGKVK